MRTSIATVCLSGSLTDKLQACADAGFDGVEIMDTDLTVSYESPEEIRALCQRLGLSIDLFQPFRDFEGVSEELLADNLHRAEAKFQLMSRLGAETILVCSNAGTATVDDDDVVAAQLAALADLAAGYGIRIAYEALAWGRYVNDYRHAWRLVKLADRPNLGTCLDSFHILARGHDPAGIEAIDGEKIFFIQLADAPQLDMDVLSWSRHHRLFPGEGSFDLSRFLTHVLKAGYTGPLSLEVFNDTFRQTDATSTAAHARRSLTWLADRVSASNGWSADRLPAAQSPRSVDFVEITGSDLGAADETLNQLGFTFRGKHRTKQVRLWTLGSTRIILNEQSQQPAPHLSAIGLLVDDAGQALSRGSALGAPVVFRRTYAGDHELRALGAPDGTVIYWNDAPAEETWVTEFEGGQPAQKSTHAVDHINLSYRWHEFEETVLFFHSVLGLEAQIPENVPSPQGLVRSQVMRTEDATVRLPLNLAPPTAPLPPRHIAVTCSNIVELASRAQERGLCFLSIPDNYYADLEARFGLAPEYLAQLKTLNLLYDRDDDGEFIHFYTPTIGGLFLEMVQRVGTYDGYGAANAPVRLAAQRRQPQASR
ncbi:bifunctional sugar phosphate isomerase/epimerase/4-hydroxyphenylpyruvate dioxygenase family protein [Nesterenkonia sp. DZ6]|uniref:bifunctional sugar phosphate isomerase/epimerase/4-hydroxyphenylpyruvate dioxygenase family protein n=1 Tax=Nesterenkonia sp. DZ6 TaxID=2901229 RepID=UPI001F4C7098|nr:sugar phosphate isomerase/epimerase and 4-hydroxyphenylpyruvate domain-containing protein [Nesterenkonia sp. DZ6]MCH8561577.1 sugar phosphate isomerase/epimerase and 4-hydroxyphenylpyruvate domain-containing protein [Nesterenkonia sp. DZ6]